MWIGRERYKGNIRELIEATQWAVLILEDGMENGSDPARSVIQFSGSGSLIRVLHGHLFWAGSDPTGRHADGGAPT
jgi:hypothetical protein